MTVLPQLPDPACPLEPPPTHWIAVGLPQPARHPSPSSSSSAGGGSGRMACVGQENIRTGAEAGDLPSVSWGPCHLTVCQLLQWNNPCGERQGVSRLTLKKTPTQNRPKGALGILRCSHGPHQPLRPCVPLTPPGR